MEEYEVMEYFSVGSKQTWAVDKKLRIYLEWPNLYFLIT